MALLKKISLGILALFYVVAGINHFLNPAFYVAIMPGWIPAHAAMVALSGVAEIALGVLVLLPATRRLAAFGIIAMLVVFLPVHVHMLVNAEQFPEAPVAFLWLRFPIQVLFGLWAWWHAQDG